MSITLTTTPNAHVAAFAPVIIAGTTSRNPFTRGVRQSKLITGYSDSGGFLRLAVTAGNEWEFDDTILISGEANDKYNGRHQITSVSSEYIKTATAYTTSGSGGTAYRMNDGLAVLIRVLNKYNAEIAVMYSDVDPTDGSFSHDISKALRYELCSYFVFSLAAEEQSTDNASHEYTIQICESWLDDNYVTETSGFDTTFNIIGHLTTEILSYFAFNGRNNGYFNTWVLLHYSNPFILNETPENVYPGRFVITTPEGVTNTASLTNNNSHFAYTYSTNQPWIKVKVQHYHNVWYDVSPEIILKSIGCSGNVLHYLDRYGNYLQFPFHNYDEQQASTKVDKYTGEAWKERTLYGIPFMNDEYPDIRDLITSPEVYDENLTRVRVTTTELEYRSEEVEPKITLRYDENFMQ